MSSTTAPPVDPPVTGAPGLVAEASRAIGGLFHVLWAARAAGEKLETVAAIEELKSRLDAVELQVVADLEATKAPETLGWASTKDFLTAITGGHKGSGPAMVRLAEALDQPVLAPIAEALGDGWLSTTKAHVVERTIDRLPLGEELRARGVQTMLDEAKRCDASDLRKIGRRLIEVIDPDGVERRDQQAMEREERAAHLNRNLSITDDDMGGARIKGSCTAEDAAVIRATLLPLTKPQPTSPDGTPTCDPATCDLPGCSHDGRDPRDHGTRSLDALVEACRRLSGAQLLPDSHHITTRVNVLIDLDDLKASTRWGTTDTGEDLSAATVRKMACDAEIIPTVLGTDSAVLDVGRAMRLVTATIWHALVVRDRHCRFPGCTRPPIMCHAHHLQHWADGGPTSLDNLILLCGHHHRLIHARPWQITRTEPGVLAFHPPEAVRRAPGPRPDRAPPDR